MFPLTISYMAEDFNGVEFIYPAKKSNPVIWVMDDDPKNDEHIIMNTTSFVYNVDGTFSYKDPSKVRMGYYHNPAIDDSIGGCDMDFAACVERGYGSQSDDPRDIEAKILVNITGGSSDGRFILAGMTGNHPSNSSPCCQGFSYGVRFFWDTNPMKVQFYKEVYHVNYHTYDKDFTNTALVNNKLIGYGWIGIGMCRYNVTEPSGKISVVLEAWVDINGDGKDWKLFAKIVDTGGWGTGGDECNGDKDQIGVWGNNKFRYRLDDKNFVGKFKHATVREIDPFDDFDSGDESDNIEVESSQIGFKDITFQRHMNLTRTGGCSTIAASQTFYDQQTQNGDTDLKSTNYRCGEKCKTTNSVMYNKALHGGSVWLRRTGTQTNDLEIAIKKKSDSSRIVLHTITAANLNSLIGTSETKYDFTCSGNTYKFALDDELEIKHQGTSSIYISVYRHGSVSYDGSDSKRFTDNDGSSGYSEKSGDLKAVLYE